MKLDLPGYTVLGTLRATGSNLLLHAVREADGLSVILKMPKAPAPDAAERERYRREFSLLQRLRGVRGVATPHALEWLQNRPVLVLERVRGEPLSELTGQPMELSRFLRLALSLAATLTEVHRRDVIHKDIKPSNIIIEPSGEARLIDFGAATLQPVEHLESTPAHVIEGTLAYMSPEQTGRMNRAVDYRTDFYSLGVTFHELLTGQVPFQARDALEWFHAHMTRKPRPLHELVPQVPPALSALVLKLLAKVAEERYQSAEGLHADLERCREVARRDASELFALGTRDTPQRFQLPRRLYGRESQVALLLEGFERVARTGQPEWVLVSGYSGSGKSSVVHELYKPVVARRAFFLSGKFDQFQRDIPYAPLVQVLNGLVRQLLAGSEEELARWRERVTRAWDGQGRRLVELVPSLEWLVGPQPAPGELPAHEDSRRFVQALRQLLRVFSPPERPLVLFLDDLQWADPSSLRLMEQLLQGPDAPPVLWLGAYRDSEVNPTHPLLAMTRELNRQGVGLTHLVLGPLSVEQVEQVVGDTLPGAGPEVVAPLAALVHQKTGGNPFFLLRLLVTLHQDGLLMRPSGGGWRWDADGVRQRGYSENVVDFMAGALRQLPPATQHLLRLAACAGPQFALSLLGVLSDLPEAHQVEQALEPALRASLLVRAGPEEYRFPHDRIQQAAHALSSEEERQRTHLRIGRLLLERLSPEQLHESIFEVVSQLNSGMARMESPAERHQLARLNAEAAKKAQNTLAQRSALTYFATAFALIPGDPWETDYPLAFQLRLSQARTAFLNGEVSEPAALIEQLLARARTRVDSTAIHLLAAEFHIQVGQLAQGLERMLESLELLGMPMPRRPTWEQAVEAHEEVWGLLGTRPLESLVELPLMTDPELKRVVTTLSRLQGIAYNTNSRLFLMLMSRIVSLTLRHGFVDSAAAGYAWFGAASSWFFKRYEEGFAFARLALAFVDRHHLSAQRGAVLSSMPFSCYWVRPLAQAQEFALEGLHHAARAGNIPTVNYCGTHLVAYRLALGHPLEEVYEEALARGERLREVGFLGLYGWVLALQRYVQQLRGLTRSFSTLSGEDFDESAFEARLTPETLSVTRYNYWALKLQSRFMCGDHAQAREAADRMLELAQDSCASLTLREGLFFRALTLAACHERAPAEERPGLLEAIAHHHRQLAEWSEHCPQNFRALERLVFAEQARLLGRGDEAAQAYEESLREAQASAAPHFQGLASELAANFWRARRTPIVAQAFAREARAAYARWGAWGKVRHLEAQWPHLLSDDSASEFRSTQSSDSTRIDTLTLLKAQQAVSEEIVLERLVAALMRAALENAGAQRGALLLPEGEGLSVASLVHVSPEGTLVAAQEPGATELPWSLISYVRRTREHVLLGDTSLPHAFSADEYLSRGEARSVLCLPLLRHEQWAGALYLENDLATNAFSPARLTLLGHLASQAAISIENARLYEDVRRTRQALRQANDELERRVEERTHELKQAQARLVDTAREVGMAEVASNVLHNVGNVLTSAVTSLEMMRRSVGSLRVGRVKQTATLLVNHREGLADFLSQDPRGSQLPDYLLALGDELLREQTGLMEDMDAMNRHVEHIRAIVQVQQKYARSALLTEECDLALLVEDALRIQLPALRRHGVTVHQELGAVPRVNVDKHKVLQILVNLLSNARYALDAVPEDQRRVWLRLSAEGRVARIQVEDNGMGIAPEVTGSLFAHGFTTRKEGQGFGLHSSALAAQLMKGRLSLESAGPGQGAVATLELPLDPVAGG